MNKTKLFFVALSMLVLQVAQAQEIMFNPGASISNGQLLFPASGDYGSAPIPLERKAPGYPVGLRLGGFGGSVTVKFTVGEDGTVTDAEVVEATSEAPRRNVSPRALDAARNALSSSTLAAIRAWKFEAATAAARFVPVTANSSWRFTVTSRGSRTLSKVHARALLR